MKTIYKFIAHSSRLLLDKVVSRLMLVLVGMVSSSMTFAHEGHGTPGTVMHDVQHAAWLVLAISAVLVIGVVLKQKLDRIRRGE